MNLYKFTNPEMSEDEINPKTGRVLKYKTVCTLGNSEQEVREDYSKTSPWFTKAWSFENSTPLNKDWN